MNRKTKEIINGIVKLMTIEKELMIKIVNRRHKAKMGKKGVIQEIAIVEEECKGKK